MDINTNVELYLKDRQPGERYTSFDYCYNYFQSFKEQEKLRALVDSDNLQRSCMQIGFYLASWGMFRGSTILLTKSAKFLEPLVRFISEADPSLWRVDVDRYDDDNLELLMQCERKIAETLSKGGPASATLVTKIMLGVFGNVPAFDINVNKGLKTWNAPKAKDWLGSPWQGRSLRKVRDFYEENKSEVNKFHIATLDFASGMETLRKYPKAKVVDMFAFIAGLK